MPVRVGTGFATSPDVRTAGSQEVLCDRPLHEFVADGTVFRGSVCLAAPVPVTLTERIALARSILAQMRAIRARLDPIVLAKARHDVAVQPATSPLRAEALRCLATRPDPQRPAPRSRK